MRAQRAGTEEGRGVDPAMLKAHERNEKGDQEIGGEEQPDNEERRGDAPRIHLLGGGCERKRQENRM